MKKKKEKNLNGSKLEKVKEYISDGLKIVLFFWKYYLVVYFCDLVGGILMKLVYVWNEVVKDL